MEPADVKQWRSELSQRVASEETRSEPLPTPVSSSVEQTGIGGTTSDAGMESAPALPNDPAPVTAPRPDSDRFLTSELVVVTPGTMEKLVPPLPTTMGEPLDVSSEGVIFQWDTPRIGPDGARQEGLSIAVLAWEQYKQCLILHWKNRKETEQRDPPKVQNSKTERGKKNLVKQGTVLAFHPKRGWCSIQEPGLPTEVFFTSYNVKTPFRNRYDNQLLCTGDQVTYTRHRSAQGWCAWNVQRCEPALAPPAVLTTTNSDLTNSTTITTVCIIAATEHATKADIRIQTPGDLAAPKRRTTDTDTASDEDTESKLSRSGSVRYRLMPCNLL
ncbi:uncharacterized protein LOC143802694 [Ranitomeya variabilis]|uniref:uncharacterized protein LOC143802694 n=1 Tax=Ranitomeya variabilis TaxID=490064 RepID=UPI0040577E38